MTNLTLLPNIGPELERKLNQIGIMTFDDLIEMGSVGAMIRMGMTDKTACYNMLYALEGAIRGVRWHLIPKDDRLVIKAEFDRAISG